MALARAFRPDQRERPVRPIGPALDQAKRSLVRNAAEKVIAGEALRVRKSQRKLTRSIHGAWSGLMRTVGGANPTGPPAGSPL